MFCDGKSTMLIEVGDASEHTCTDELSVCTCVAEVCVSLEMSVFFFSFRKTTMHTSHSFFLPLMFMLATNWGQCSLKTVSLQVLGSFVRSQGAGRDIVRRLTQFSNILLNPLPRIGYKGEN